MSTPKQQRKESVGLSRVEQELLFAQRMLDTRFDDSNDDDLLLGNLTHQRDEDAQ